MATFGESVQRDDATEPERELITCAQIGQIVHIDVHSRVYVDHAKNPDRRLVPATEGVRGLLAKSNVPIQAEDIGAPVTLLFEDGDPRRPVIIGKVWQAPGQVSAHGLALTVNDERLEVIGEREIVIRCGKASITLTRAGKIVLRGTYILQASSGANKIKGATVHIN